jgi:hypothetical protein
LRRIIYPNTIAIENDGCNFLITANYEVIEWAFVFTIKLSVMKKK